MTLLLWTWELPQTLLGACLLGLQRARGKVHAIERCADGRRLVQTERIGVSLGGFVFWFQADPRRRRPQDWILRAHELGHTVQSRRLGWLYLPTVGLASVSRVITSAVILRRTGRPWGRYYDAWPEDAADRHGGVLRGPKGARYLPPEGCRLDPQGPRGPDPEGPRGPDPQGPRGPDPEGPKDPEPEHHDLR